MPIHQKFPYFGFDPQVDTLIFALCGTGSHYRAGGRNQIVLHEILQLDGSDNVALCFLLNIFQFGVDRRVPLFRFHLSRFCVIIEFSTATRLDNDIIISHQFLSCPKKECAFSFSRMINYSVQRNRVIYVC